MTLFKKQTEEDKELKLAKQKQKAQQAAFKQLQALNRSKIREDLANQRAERTQKVLAQKTAETQAKQRLYEARKAYGDRRLAVFKGNVTRTVAAAKPYVAPSIKVGGQVLRHVAKADTTSFYELGTRPTNSPSYQALENAFGSEPFTVGQAIEVVMNALRVDYLDAQNRLHQMRLLGFIKVEKPYKDYTPRREASSRPRAVSYEYNIYEDLP